MLDIETPNILIIVSSFEESNLEDIVERRRLAASYAAKTDGELLHLAGDPESLTETAWETLEDELERRHLDVPSEPVQGRQELELRNLVPVRRFRDLPEALLAKGSLESAGIECVLRDENIIRLDWFISNFIGGIKLCVRPEDAEKARALLDEPMLEGFYVEGVGLYEQPRCPQCGSLDVSSPEQTVPRFLGAGANEAMPSHRTAWRCCACFYEWEQDETPGSAESSS